ncbi:hypothetical protein [Pseudanabaena sp. PCC 6802]|nr:hypothetical protein [Pseudanabaena sp. PCC 6802]
MAEASHHRSSPTETDGRRSVMTVERWTEETLDRFAATVVTAIAAN